MVVDNDSGQSLLEFLFLLPMLVGFTFMLLKVDTTIQMSIVNQQYSRAQAFFLTFNSAFFPELKFKGTPTNRFIAGVQGEPSSEDSGKVNPDAPVHTISRRGKPQGSNATQEEPPLRGKVRVRNTIAICTQSDMLGPSLAENVASVMGDSYCRSPSDE